MIKINTRELRESLGFCQEGIVWEGGGLCSIHGPYTGHLCRDPHDHQYEDPDVRIMRNALSDAGVDATLSVKPSGDISVRVGPTEHRSVDEIHGILERLYSLAQ